MYMFNIDGLEEPLSLIFRGSGIGAVNKINKAGHSVYIWNIENPGYISGSTILSSGGWQRLDEVSDPAGTKDTVSAPLVRQLQNIDRYVVNTRIGRVIAIMVVCEGRSFASIEAQGDQYNLDLNATLSIDYIKLQDIEVETYKGNNKCDIYVSTVKNADNMINKSIDIVRADNDAYFTINEDAGFDMPIASIDSIIDTSTGSILSPSDYSIIRTNNSYIGSSKDSFYISSPDFTAITIEYSTYNNVAAIQDFFDGDEYGKIFGDVLIRHKYPTYLDISFTYYGPYTTDEMSAYVREYFDSNVNTVFDVNLMTSYLYNNNYVNYIKDVPIVSYETILDSGSVESGSVTTFKTIRPIDFFRIRNLNMTKATS